MTEPVAEKMTEAIAEPTHQQGTTAARPIKGDRFRCANCGMEIVLVTDCGCPPGMGPELHCCGHELTRL